MGGTRVAKREWGAKHTCMGCGVKFYDLHRRPITCPKCGTEIFVETTRPIRRRPPVQPEPPQPASVETGIEAEADETDDDGDEIIADIDADDDDDLVDGIDDKTATQPEP